MTTDGSSYLRIEAATKVFAGVPAVKDFHLDIAAGEFVSLLGPSGCGKTTLLRMVAGFEFPDAGRIVLDGRDITGMPAHKRPVNMVFQRVTLFPHLDVFENVAFGLRLKRISGEETRRRVGEALELVRLPAFAKRSVNTLSGGQAQRVALARAVVNRPKVLLFDEPLSALDLQIRRELQVELKDIHRELNGTFAYVTHDQEEAMSMSDRVVVMRDGEIVQVGSPVELYRAPATLFVARFVGSPNVWRGTIVDLDGAEAIVAVGNRRLRTPLCAGATRGERVAIVLRSEAIALAKSGHAAAGDTAFSVEGVVGDVRFVGAVVNYRIDVGDRALTVTRPSRDVEVLGEGDRVTASWRTQDLLLLKAEDADVEITATGSADGEGERE
jgi:spermidine/putrescine transport system ATP-binding protein